ncbi:MAG: hypothetical protein GY870_03745 [archaeon]|nr:hypothetical protein [archaeon]
MNLDKSPSKKFKVHFKTRLNVVWGKPLKNDKREAVAYAEGFPGIFYMTDRRAIVTGTFMEKKGMIRRQSYNTVYYEAGLQYIKKVELGIYKKVRSGYISFKPHGDIENGVIHFINMDPKMLTVIQETIDNVKNLKKVRKDTGIVVLGIDPEIMIKKRVS